LALAVRQFRDHGFKLELTLARSLATPALWSALARTLAVFDNVIGYDVINEPYECNTVRQTEGGAANFKELLLAVRAQDQSTPVVLEPLEWASHDQLEQLPMELFNQRSAGENHLLVAPHMYWPFPLTSRRTNAGRFSFPGKVPVYNGKHAPVVDCNDDLMREVVSGVSAWGRQVLGTPSRVFLGEVGINREIAGAREYLKSILRACLDFKLSCFLYAFREEDWNGHDYELGTQPSNTLRFIQGNPLMFEIMTAVRAARTSGLGAPTSSSG